MQKPLNTTERNSAFWKFFLFFLISVAMVTAALYFDFRMPVKENLILKEKAEQMKILNLQQEEITNTLIVVKNLIDSANKPGANSILLKELADKKLGDLSKLNIGDSSIQKKMNIEIIKVYTDYNYLKNKMISQGDPDAKIAGLEGNIEKLKGDIMTLQAQLDGYRNPNRR
jgi:Type VI secretion system, TssO